MTSGLPRLGAKSEQQYWFLNGRRREESDFIAIVSSRGSTA